MSAAWWQAYQVERASKTNFHIRQMPVNLKVPLRGTCTIPPYDQAANLSEVLAWSFSLKSVLRTAYIFDVLPGTNNKRCHQRDGSFDDTFPWSRDFVLVVDNQIDDFVHVGDVDLAVAVHVGSGYTGVTRVAAHDDDINHTIGIRTLTPRQRR